MNKAKQLIMELEVKEFLNEETKRIAKGMKDSFPIIKEVNVAVHINYTMFEKEKQ